MVIKSGKGNIEEIKESAKEGIIERIDAGYKTDHRAVLAFTDQCTSGGTGPYRSALVRIY